LTLKGALFSSKLGGKRRGTRKRKGQLVLFESRIEGISRE